MGHRTCLGLVLALGIPAFAASPPAMFRADRRIEHVPAIARGERIDPTERGPIGAAARSFVDRFGGTWEFTVDRRTGRAVLVRGSGIPWVPGAGNTLPAAGPIDLDSLEAIARRFLAERGGWLEPEVGRLVLDREASTITRGGRAIALLFSWEVDGVPVEDARVFLHLNSGNLVQFGAPLVGQAPGGSHPTVTARRAIELATDHGADGPAYELRGKPALVFQPEENDPHLEYRLVWIVRYRVPGAIETWEARVDAHTGEVLSYVDANRYGRVLGGVYPRTWFERNETRVPMSYASVDLEQGAASSDVAGAFAYSGGPASSGLDGPWVETDCSACMGPSQPLAGVSSGIGWLDFGVGGVNGAGNGRSTPADRNAYYHLSQARRIAKKWLPQLAWLDETLVAHTNIVATCNAVYDGDVYFFKSSPDCGNTGEIADVIYHEWGHGIDFATVAGDGATGEGTADVASMQITHSALMGPGFLTDGSPVRNLDSNGPRGLLSTANVATKCSRSGSAGPLGFEVHCEGEIYGQTAWDLAQALVARHGPQTGWRESERLFFTSLPFAAGYLPSAFPSVYDAYVLVDDTDGNLSNGTPNGAEIYAAFQQHGIAGQPVGSQAYCTRPAQPVVTATPSCDRIDLSWTAVSGAARYVVLRGEVRLDQASFELAAVLPPERTYTDTDVAPGVSYWYVVLAETASGCESRIESPVAAQLVAQPILSATFASITDSNGSGYADPDEDVELAITLENVGTAASDAGDGVLSAAAPVTLLDTSASWPAVDPGASATNQDGLRFRAPSPENSCADVVRFRLAPSSGAVCAAEPSWIDVPIGDPQGMCEPSPPCSTPPTFAGIASAAAGPGCGTATLSWGAAMRNCVNSFVRYSVYRSTSPGFSPGPETLVASGVKPTAWVDTGLFGGATYHYTVRAVDSLGGGEGNGVALAVEPPSGPDLGPPTFSGLSSVVTGEGCGVVALGWSPATEECSGPVWYDVYRSADDPYFQPGPPTLVGSTTGMTFEDSGVAPSTEYWYVVRARDGAGNQTDHGTSFPVRSSGIDRMIWSGSFEASAQGWELDPASDATNGNWELGDPAAFPPYQPEDCADGEKCWITGLPSTLPGGQPVDVDGGSTTLRSWSLWADPRPLHPALDHSVWVAGSPTTGLLVEAHLGNGPFEPPYAYQAWIGATDPPAWRRVRHRLTYDGPFQTARFTFTMSAFNSSTMDEAGIDDWAYVDEGAECFGCTEPAPPVGTIFGRRQGDDVVLDWTQDGTSGARFAVYTATTPDFSDAARIGTTASRTFTHDDAGLLPQDLYYLVSSHDVCGNESTLH